MTDQLLRRTWVEIDLDALTNNFRRIRESLTAGCKAMAIVKADAYGHGAVECARILAKAGADWFGVSNLEEAIQLRRAGLSQPVLILSYTPPQEAARLARYGITQTVTGARYAAELSAEAVKAGVTVPVHIAVDTGMMRVGFLYSDAERDAKTVADIATACRLPSLDATGIFTHFAVADEQTGDAFTQHQFALFMQAIDLLCAEGITFALRHCCNSAATVRFPEMHLDLVRPGLIQYGMMPSAFMRELLPLQPVMSLKTNVSLVKTVPAGETVSYGRTYTAPQDIRTATVAIGYADGYARRCSNSGHMLIDGHEVPVIGRVCMDQCMLDVSALPDVREDDTALIFGRDGAFVRPVEQYAAECETINYEVVCDIGRRVPRVFMQNGRPVGVRNDLLEL
ncbi:MAG: alanine racemase [Clostridia bacterium]|nr:alanine racemase [Clostridia bacterium]